ncbi:hypothetical protein EDB89DRAFT_802829 [Lactarius sanguifluus]|nr:hypothetical protein EDB89DRAFT_802829 [Lactarius sanguifluus]
MSTTWLLCYSIFVFSNGRNITRVSDDMLPFSRRRKKKLSVGQMPPLHCSLAGLGAYVDLGPCAHQTARPFRHKVGLGRFQSRSLIARLVAAARDCVVAATHGPTGEAASLSILLRLRRRSATRAIVSGHGNISGPRTIRLFISAMRRSSYCTRTESISPSLLKLAA